MTPQSQMHKEFPVWYAEVSIGDDEPTRNARWEGIVSLVSEVDYSGLETLLRLVIGGRCQPSHRELTALYRPFTDTDGTFTARGNEREIQILAGAALVRLMEQSDTQMGDAAALGVVTAGFAGNRRLDLPFDLIEIAEHSIRRRAENNRTRRNMNEGRKRLGTTINVDSVDQLLTSGVDPNSVHGAITGVVKSIEYRLGTVIAEHNRAIEAIDHFVKVQDEELEMLWWLVGEYSSIHDCPLVDIDTYQKPLVVALDIAGMTRILPGPAAVRAFLSRAGLDFTDRVKICDIANAVEEHWVTERCSMDDVSAATTPVYEAIRRRLETGSGEAWIAGWAAVTGLLADVELSSLDVGLQFYRETLYLRR